MKAAKRDADLAVRISPAPHATAPGEEAPATGTASPEEVSVTVSVTAVGFCCPSWLAQRSQSYTYMYMLHVR